VERHCALARRFAAALGAEPGVAVLNQVKLNQVIIRFGAGEDVAISH
jgi:glutamate/tyrosine decarboxylase-like PLP-dependent enzyme